MDYLHAAFELAMGVSLGIFVGLLWILLRAIKPYANFERGVATLIWAFPTSVLATMVLAYLDLPYIFLSLFGSPGLSAAVRPPAESAMWRGSGALLLARSVFISLVTAGVVEATWR